MPFLRSCMNLHHVLELDHLSGGAAETVMSSRPLLRDVQGFVIVSAPSSHGCEFMTYFSS